MVVTQFKDIRALVTGANRGIGRAIVDVLLEQGAAKVYAAARNTKSLEGLEREAGSCLELLSLDVTNNDQIRGIAGKLGDLNVLINNAGVSYPLEPFNDRNLEYARAEMEVNYFGPLYLIHYLLPTLMKNTGAIVNIASVGGLANYPPVLTYSASKAAIHSITQGLRALLKNKGVHVVGVYPGPIDTDMSRHDKMEKISPKVVAENLFSRLFEGTEDIFPDPPAQQFGNLYMANPKDAERLFAASLGG